MEETNGLPQLPTDKVIGLFGDFQLPSTGDNPNSYARKNILKKLLAVLIMARPKKVYFMPTSGVMSALMVSMSKMNIPYTLVIPYTGYFDNYGIHEKLNTFVASETVGGLILIKDEAKSLEEQNSCLKEAEEFIINRSNTLCLVFRHENNSNMNFLSDKIRKTDKHLLHVNYEI